MDLTGTVRLLGFLGFRFLSFPPFRYETLFQNHFFICDTVLINALPHGLIVNQNKALIWWLFAIYVQKRLEQRQNENFC